MSLVLRLIVIFGLIAISDQEQSHAAPFSENSLQDSIKTSQSQRRKKKKRKKRRSKKQREDSESFSNYDKEDLFDDSAGSGSSGRGDKYSLSKYDRRASAGPSFSVYFDLYLQLQPDGAPFTFNNFHNILLFDFSPSKKVNFNFEVRPVPRFWEFSYDFSKKFRLRLGRIWIPFDSLNPHNSFGGRVNVTPFNVDSTNAFLPDLWTDLGVALQYQIVDQRSLGVTLHAYVVNGFTSGGTDPTGETPAYPNFGQNLSDGTSLIVDNNGDKSLGARVEFQFSKRTINLGASVYQGRWSDEADLPARLLAFGFDAQFNLGMVSLKGGYINMLYGLLPLNPEVISEEVVVNRGGLYAQLSAMLGKSWRARGRFGTASYDDRIATSNDQTIAGGDLSYFFGVAEIGALVNLNLASEDNEETTTETTSQPNLYTALRFTVHM